MNKTVIIVLAFIAGIVVGVLIVGVGMMVAMANWGTAGNQPFNMMGWAYGNVPTGFSMMGGYGSGGNSNTKPLTVEQVRKAVDGYLKGLNNPELEIKEIMIFANNAYARITEKSTGTGAMELLVDPASLSVFPEYGPNMMWNLKYGHTTAHASRAGGNGMMGSYGGMMGGRGMMGGTYYNPGSVSATMTVTPDQALKTAQQFLDQQYPGYQTAKDADPFYGYYTIDILKDGKPTGMLSVNGFNGQVFPHTWHGAFIEISE